jgi:hypothetical protein
MYQVDVAPRMSFEHLARRFGVSKARDILRRYEDRLRRDEHVSTKQEERAAAIRHRRGPMVLKDDDIVPDFQISALGFKKLWRETWAKGGKGGENLQDDDYMRAFLKKNPACAMPRYVTGKIRSGWTAQLEHASRLGKMERALPIFRASEIIADAAKQQPLIQV